MIYVARVLTVGGGHSLAVVSESGQRHVEVRDDLRRQQYFLELKTEGQNGVLSPDEILMKTCRPPLVSLTCRLPAPARWMAWMVSSTLLRSLISTERLDSSGI